jgi:UDP-N-acetylglucosamine:LPS N-acetylglucosamine transferase
LPNSESLDQRATVGLVCSHGGHLTEMLALAPAFEGFDVFYYCYDAATTRGLPRVYLVPNRPYNPLQFAWNLFRAVRILRAERPVCVVSTGAEIAVPMLLAARLLRIPTLYLECGCQVRTPSTTGRVAAWLATRLWVQWPELLPAYRGRAAYHGSLIDTGERNP